MKPHTPSHSPNSVGPGVARPSESASSSSTPSISQPTMATSCRAYCLSIRTVASVLSALLLIASAAIVIVVMSHYAMSAAEDVAKQHADVIASSAKGQIENQLRQPVQYGETWQYLTAAGQRSLPIDDPAAQFDERWRNDWYSMLISPMRATNFRFRYSVIGFDDGSYIGCNTDDNATFETTYYFWGKRNASNASDVSSASKHQYFQANYSLIKTYGDTTTTYDPRTRPWYSQVNHTKGSIRWSNVYLSAVPTLPIVDANIAIFNATGAFLGVASLTYDLDTVSHFLSAAATVKGVTLIALDNNDLVVGTSASAPFLNTTSVAASFNGSIPENCLLSDSAQASKSVLVCRASARTYDFPPLKELANKLPDTLAAGTVSSMSVALEGTTFYVSVLLVETPGASNMRWRVLLFLPVSEITNGIVTGRNLSIYISVSVVVVALLISLLFFTLLLRPLHIIAERMYRAATMQDMEDGEGVHFGSCVSLLYEMSTIQHAFGSLVFELAKVKSFLPQSVLEELYGSSSENNIEPNEDDEASHVDEGGFRGASSGSSMSNRNRLSFFQTEDSNFNSTTTRMEDSSNPLVTQQNPFGSGVLSHSAHHHGPSRVVAAANASMSSSTGGHHHLNTGIGLKARKVTMLIFNVCDYHSQLQGHTNTEVALGHSKIVKMIGDSTLDGRGVLDGFQGDRFVVSFNAVTTVGNHALNAAKVCASVAERFSTSRMCVSSGIASGQALVGNVGSMSTKRFTILSPAVSNAAALERLCKHFGPLCGPVTTLIGGSAAADIENFFELLTVDGVVLPGSTVTGAKARVSLLVEPKRTGPGEWMYQLQEGAVKSEFAAVNSAFDLLHRSEFPQAISEATTALRQLSAHGESYTRDAPVTTIVPILEPPPSTSTMVFRAPKRSASTANRATGSSFDDHQSPLAEAAKGCGGDPMPTSLGDLQRRLLRGIVAAANHAMQNARISDVILEGAESATEGASSLASSLDGGRYVESKQQHPNGSSLSLLGLTDDFYARCVLPVHFSYPTTSSVAMTNPAQQYHNIVTANSTRNLPGNFVLSSYNSAVPSSATTPKPVHLSKPVFRSLADNEDIDLQSDIDQNLQDIASRCGL